LGNPEDDPGAISFEEYSARWLAGKKATRKFGTSHSYAAMLSGHLLPSFGAKALRDISRADVRQLCSEKLGGGIPRDGGISNPPRFLCKSLDLLGHVELATTNLYAHPVSNAQEIVGRLDHMGKSANPCKQEDTGDGKVRQK
jgi:hypothetical protein